MRITVTLFIAAALGVLSFFAGPADASTQSYSKFALSGQEISILQAANVRADCSNMRMPTVRFLVVPSHGKARVVNQKVYTGYGPNNIRVKCNTKATVGLNVFYRSHRGFTGVDRVVIETIFADGVTDKATIAIQVE